MEKLKQNNFSLGLTIIELLTIVAILTILTSISIPLLRIFQKESDLTNTAEEIINVLRLTQNKTLASQETSQWGIYFSISISPQEYILFKGSDYSSRDPSYDLIHKVPEDIEIYEVDLAGGGTEVVFERVTGTTNYSGSISLRLKEDALKTRQVIVEQSGKVVSSQEAAPSDTARIKDSRHVHFDYNRSIDTLNEILTLTFTYNASSETRDIIIADNMKGGQIYWEGEVDVVGSIQKIKIHSHRLNDAGLGTEFCAHRDERYNDKALTIEISGDGSGNLIQYDEEGQTSQGTSIYASTPIWQ